MFEHWTEIAMKSFYSIVNGRMKHMVGFGFSNEMLQICKCVNRICIRLAHKFCTF